MADVTDDLRRYAGVIEPMLRSATPFAPGSETDNAVQVERGQAFVRALLDPRDVDLDRVVGRLTDVALSGYVPHIAIIDRMGHRRPAYRGLLVYAWLRAYALVYETLPSAMFGRWDEVLRTWCDTLEADLLRIRPTGETIPASQGDSVAGSAWIALSLSVAGKLFVRDAWTDLAADTFGRLTRAQQPSGAFLTNASSDNPETSWYHELVILHAAASFAVQAEDRTVASAVRRATDYHQAETQPDHATTQPWAVFAFIWNERTRPLADQLLHAAQVQNPHGLSGVPLMLLADALYCLRLFL